MLFSPWHFFTDPVLQAPTIGSMLMCFCSGLVGVMVFLRKRSLLGEALSHATYPGVVLSVLFMATFFPASSDLIAIAILVGGFFSALLGLWVIEKMERVFRVKSDAALCFVLSVFFGVGVLVASRIQFTHALWYKTIQIFLYGQAATMTPIHVILYGGLALLLTLVFLVLYRPIQMALFDRDFSSMVGLPKKCIETLLFFLLILAIVIGIRSVGVVLMAGMLIAPAVCARQLSCRFGVVLVLSACVGAISGFLGNYLSVILPPFFGGYFSLPTGPMILLSASCLCLLSLCFAPRNGMVSRLVRVIRFRAQCREDNLLKFLWKQPDSRVAECDLYLSFLERCFLLGRLKREGWIERREHAIALTKEGYSRAMRIVRLHRLWEAYLVSLGQGAEKVHRSAEEMEHVITPELEKELADLLGDPKRDPHAQPIPSKEDL